MKKPFYFLVIIFLFSFTQSFSQAGIYVKFDGIANKQPGAHAGEFLVTSFETTDSSNTNIGSSSGGPGAGKTFFGAIKLQKLLDPPTNPILMKDVATGRHLTKASITWYNSSGDAYYQINLNEVIIQSVSILSPSCSGTNCNNLYEEIHLSYVQIQWKDPVSGAESGWDLRKNAAL